MNKPNGLKIPKLLNNLGIDFCINLQKLHDSSFNWCSNDKNLTLEGKLELSGIIKKFNLDESKFKKFL